MAVDVVIVGGGPNGLMLASELRLGGVRPVVLERLASPSEAPKANGLVGQVVRVLDYRGLYQPLARGGTWAALLPRARRRRDRPVPARAYMFGGFQLDLRNLRDHPLYTLAVPQHRLEQVLEERARELGAEIRRGHELIGFVQDGGGFDVDVEGPDGAYRLRIAIWSVATARTASFASSRGSTFRGLRPGTSSPATLTWCYRSRCSSRSPVS